MTSQDTDVYQERYLAHQARKKEKLSKQLDGVGNSSKITEFFFKKSASEFRELALWRTSQRIFSGDEIPEESMEYLKEILTNTPSSCNRQAIKISIIKESNNKALLEELLVGGKGWIGKSDRIMLLLADMEAYKSPNEVDFMPYLDAGFIGMNTYYAAEARGVGCCFVNPNIRDENLERFRQTFIGENNYRFCGAIALGMYDKKANKVPKSSDIFI